MWKYISRLLWLLDYKRSERKYWKNNGGYRG